MECGWRAQAIAEQPKQLRRVCVFADFAQLAQLAEHEQFYPLVRASVLGSSRSFGLPAGSLGEGGSVGLGMWGIECVLVCLLCAFGLFIHFPIPIQVTPPVRARVSEFLRPFGLEGALGF
jgi:hypothetical protein